MGFENAKFNKMPPSFHGRKFHPLYSFPDVGWPKIPKRDSSNNIDINSDGVLLFQITCYEYIRTQAEHYGQLELRKEMIRQEVACRAEVAKPSFERLLRKAYGWICDHAPPLAGWGWRCWGFGLSPFSLGADGPHMRRRSRPGMFFTTRAGACCRLSAGMPMSKSKPLTPYAPHLRRCIFSAPSPRSSAHSFCFSWAWRSGSNSACIFDVIQRRFDPWDFPPSPRRI